MDNFLSSRQKITGNPAPKDAHLPGQENPGLSNVEVLGGGANQAKVELVTEAGIIKSIIVTCKCGERTELKCHY